MRNKPIKRAEKARLTKDKCKIPDFKWISSKKDGNNGLFLFALKSKTGETRYIKCIVCDQMGWDHISVSEETGIPTWEEMVFIKRMFFKDDETVIQYHPPEKDYVNENPNTLHMWRPHNTEIPLPPKFMI